MPDSVNALVVSVVFPIRTPEFDVLIEIPESEKEVNDAALDSKVTVPVVLMFAVPEEAIRSPITKIFPVAEPELIAPKFEVFAELERITPLVPPFKVMFPVEATMFAAGM